MCGGGVEWPKRLLYLPYLKAKQKTERAIGKCPKWKSKCDQLAIVESKLYGRTAILCDAFLLSRKQITYYLR
jgi:hypothetical protein